MGHVAPGVKAVEITRAFVDGDDVLVLDTGPFTARGPKSELVVDPVCSMRIAKASAAATREHGGVTYFFCAYGCAAAFDREPARYAR